MKSEKNNNFEYYIFILFFIVKFLLFFKFSNFAFIKILLWHNKIIGKHGLFGKVGKLNEGITAFIHPL